MEPLTPLLSSGSHFWSSRFNSQVPARCLRGQEITHRTQFTLSAPPHRTPSAPFISELRQWAATVRLHVLNFRSPRNSRLLRSSRRAPISKTLVFIPVTHKGSVSLRMTENLPKGSMVSSPWALKRHQSEPQLAAFRPLAVLQISAPVRATSSFHSSRQAGHLDLFHLKAYIFIMPGTRDGSFGVSDQITHHREV